MAVAANGALIKFTARAAIVAVVVRAEIASLFARCYAGASVGEGGQEGSIITVARRGQCSASRVAGRFCALQKEPSRDNAHRLGCNEFALLQIQICICAPRVVTTAMLAALGHLRSKRANVHGVSKGSRLSLSRAGLGCKLLSPFAAYEGCGPCSTRRTPALRWSRKVFCVRSI